MASSLQAVPNWQPTSTLGKGPLPTTANVRMWAQGEGGWVARNLVHDLLLAEDIQFFADDSEDSIVH